jgi:hypothetical protein
VPAANAQGLSHLRLELFPADRIPASVMEGLPIFNQAVSAVAAHDAPGLSHQPADLFPTEHMPLDLFPTDHLPAVAWDYLPFADLF